MQENNIVLITLEAFLKELEERRQDMYELAFLTIQGDKIDACIAEIERLQCSIADLMQAVRGKNV